MRYEIDDDLLQRIYDAILALGQSRDALLTGVPPTISSSLPVLRSQAETLWSDLNQLNRMGVIRDGSVPLVTWLKNARRLAGLRRQAETFEEALDKLIVVDGAPRGMAVDARSREDSQPMDTSRALLVTVLHAPEEDTFANALRKHAAALTNRGEIQLWFEGMASPGGRREVEVTDRMGRACVVLVLLSAPFIASDTMRLVERALARGERLVPVLARSCDWESTGFGGLTPLPRSGVPIAQHSKQDAAYTQIVAELRVLVARAVASGAHPANAPPPGEDNQAGTGPSLRGDHDGPSSPPGPAFTPIWTVREAASFWTRDDARALALLMADGYDGNIRGLLDIALLAGVPPVQVAHTGRATVEVVRDVLDHARRRGAVRAVLESLRNDERIAVHHATIDEMLLGRRG